MHDFSPYKLAKAFLQWARSNAASDLLPDERTHWADLLNTVTKALK